METTWARKDAKYTSMFKENNEVIGKIQKKKKHVHF